MLVLGRLRSLTELQAPTIHKPAGSRFLAAMTVVCSKKTVEQVFAQAVADMREEHIEAVAAGHEWLARWVIVRGHFWLIVAFALYAWTRVGKVIVALWKVG